FTATRPTSAATLFPSTTLFRSSRGGGRAVRLADPGGGQALWINHCAASPVAAGSRLSHRLGRPVRPDGNQRGAGLSRPALVGPRSEEHTSELQSRFDLVCRLLL